MIDRMVLVSALLVSACIFTDDKYYDTADTDPCDPALGEFSLDWASEDVYTMTSDSGLVVTSEPWWSGGECCVEALDAEGMHQVRAANLRLLYASPSTLFGSGGVGTAGSRLVLHDALGPAVISTCDSNVDPWVTSTAANADGAIRITFEGTAQFERTDTPAACADYTGSIHLTLTPTP